MATSQTAERGTSPATAPTSAGVAGSTTTARATREARNRQLRLEYLACLEQADQADTAVARRRAQRRAEAAQAEYMATNDAIIGKVTRRYRSGPGQGHGGGDFADLEQAGRLALLEAFRTWDVEQAPSAAWAWPRVAGAVWREVAFQRGQNHRDFGRRKTVFEAEGKLAVDLGRRPTDEELAAFCAIPVDGVRRARMSSPVSLDAPATADGTMTVGDLLAATEDNPVVEGRVEAALADVAEQLSPTELAMLIRCLGVGDTALDNGPRQKVAAAGALFGLNRESARKRYNAALAAARDMLADADES